MRGWGALRATQPASLTLIGLYATCKGSQLNKARTKIVESTLEKEQTKAKESKLSYSMRLNS